MALKNKNAKGILFYTQFPALGQRHGINSKG
jgi:hypothetical protein